MNILDQMQDRNNSGLYRMRQLYGAPEFVKAASEEDLRPQMKLSQSYYGDPRYENYPLHTKAATWASYGFFLENVKKGAHRPTDAESIEARIVHAGKVHGISRSLGELKAAVAKDAPVPDENLPDSDFAIVWYENGNRERHMRMSNRHEVIKAAALLQQNRDHFVYRDRQQAAEKILEKTAELGLALPAATRDFVTKQAGYGACSAKEAAHLVRGRVEASRGRAGEMSEPQTQMLKIAAAIEASPASIRDHHFRVKLAGALDSFDRENKLHPEVRDGHLVRIEDVLFSITSEKLAATKDEYTRLPTGNLYKLADVEKIPLRDVTAVLGSDIAGAMTSDGLHLDAVKAAEVLPTLVRGDCLLFDDLMQECGFAPAAKEASADSVRLSHEYLYQLAHADA